MHRVCTKAVAGLQAGAKAQGRFESIRAWPYGLVTDTGQYTQQLKIRCLPCVSGLMIHVSSAVVWWLLLCEGQRVPGVRKHGAWVFAR